MNLWKSKQERTRLKRIRQLERLIADEAAHIKGHEKVKANYEKERARLLNWHEEKATVKSGIR